MLAKSEFTQVELNTIASLCKRRGFVFASGDIYGGLNSVRDYGPAGVELKRNIKDVWWRDFVSRRADIVGLDSAILTHAQMMAASGHAQHFTDTLAECAKCKKRYRVETGDGDCPDCGVALQGRREFNLMFETHLGAVQNDASRVYLRPETAQGIFTNFNNIITATNKKLPFGVAQIGKAFRNEITPGGFTFRMREFEQMEIEFFCAPADAPKWFDYWVEESRAWCVKIGFRNANIRLRKHTKDEMPHYAANSTDLEYKFPWDWGELESVANRADHDLTRHSSVSGKDLSYFDAAAEKRFTPYVVEPSMGVDRLALALIIDAYDEETLERDKRVVLRFHPDIAPFKLAVLPLSRSDKLTPTARRTHELLLADFNCLYDDTQSIGKRYRRQDELGTPLCVTIDFDTVENDGKVTIRNRDSMAQVRVALDNLRAAVADQLQNMRAEFKE